MASKESQSSSEEDSDPTAAERGQLTMGEEAKIRALAQWDREPWPMPDNPSTSRLRPKPAHRGNPRASAGSASDSSHDTGAPVCNHDTSAPVCNHDTSASVCSHDTSAPVCSHDTSAPVCSHDTSAPVCNHDTSASVCSHDTGASVCNHDTSASVCSHDTGASVCNHDTSAPVCSHDTSAPVCNHDTGAPVCNHDTSAPVCSQNPSVSVSRLEPPESAERGGKLTRHGNDSNEHPSSDPPRGANAGGAASTQRGQNPQASGEAKQHHHHHHHQQQQEEHFPHDVAETSARDARQATHHRRGHESDSDSDGADDPHRPLLQGTRTEEGAGVSRRATHRGDAGGASSNRVGNRRTERGRGRKTAASRSARGGRRSSLLESDDESAYSAVAEQMERLGGWRSPEAVPTGWMCGDCCACCSAFFAALREFIRSILVAMPCLQENTLPDDQNQRLANAVATLTSIDRDSPSAVQAAKEQIISLMTSGTLDTLIEVITDACAQDNSLTVTACMLFYWMVHARSALGIDGDWTALGETTARLSALMNLVPPSRREALRHLVIRPLRVLLQSSRHLQLGEDHVTKILTCLWLTLFDLCPSSDVITFLDTCQVIYIIGKREMDAFPGLVLGEERAVNWAVFQCQWGMQSEGKRYLLAVARLLKLLARKDRTLEIILQTPTALTVMIKLIIFRLGVYFSRRGQQQLRPARDPIITEIVVCGVGILAACCERTTTYLTTMLAWRDPSAHDLLRGLMSVVVGNEFKTNIKMAAVLIFKCFVLLEDGRALVQTSLGMVLGVVSKFHEQKLGLALLDCLLWIMPSFRVQNQQTVKRMLVTILNSEQPHIQDLCLTICANLLLEGLLQAEEPTTAATMSTVWCHIATRSPSSPEDRGLVYASLRVVNALLSRHKMHGDGRHRDLYVRLLSLESPESLRRVILLASIVDYHFVQRKAAAVVYWILTGYQVPWMDSVVLGLVVPLVCNLLQDSNQLLHLPGMLILYRVLIKFHSNAVLRSLKGRKVPALVRKFRKYCCASIRSTILSDTAQRVTSLFSRPGRDAMASDSPNDVIRRSEETLLERSLEIRIHRTANAPAAATTTTTAASAEGEASRDDDADEDSDAIDSLGQQAAATAGEAWSRNHLTRLLETQQIGGWLQTAAGSGRRPGTADEAPATRPSARDLERAVRVALTDGDAYLGYGFRVVCEACLWHAARAEMEQYFSGQASFSGVMRRVCAKLRLSGLRITHKSAFGRLEKSFRARRDLERRTRRVLELGRGRATACDGGDASDEEAGGRNGERQTLYEILPQLFEELQRSAQRPSRRSAFGLRVLGAEDEGQGPGPGQEGEAPEAGASRGYSRTRCSPDGAPAGTIFSEAEEKDARTGGDENEDRDAETTDTAKDKVTGRDADVDKDGGADKNKDNDTDEDEDRSDDTEKEKDNGADADKDSYSYKDKHKSNDTGANKEKDTDTDTEKDKDTDANGDKGTTKNLDTDKDTKDQRVDKNTDKTNETDNGSEGNLGTGRRSAANQDTDMDKGADKDPDKDANKDTDSADWDEVHAARAHALSLSVSPAAGIQTCTVVLEASALNGSQGLPPRRKTKKGRPAKGSPRDDEDASSDKENIAPNAQTPSLPLARAASSQQASTVARAGDSRGTLGRHHDEVVSRAVDADLGRREGYNEGPAEPGWARLPGGEDGSSSNGDPSREVSVGAGLPDIYDFTLITSDEELDLPSLDACDRTLVDSEEGAGSFSGSHTRPVNVALIVRYLTQVEQHPEQREEDEDEHAEPRRSPDSRDKNACHTQTVLTDRSSSCSTLRPGEELNNLPGDTSDELAHDSDKQDQARLDSDVQASGDGSDTSVDTDQDFLDAYSDLDDLQEGGEQEGGERNVAIEPDTGRRSPPGEHLQLGMEGAARGGEKSPVSSQDNVVTEDEKLDTGVASGKDFVEEDLGNAGRTEKDFDSVKSECERAERDLLARADKGRHFDQTNIKRRINRNTYIGDSAKFRRREETARTDPRDNGGLENRAAGELDSARRVTFVRHAVLIPDTQTYDSDFSVCLEDLSSIVSDFSVDEPDSSEYSSLGISSAHTSDDDVFLASPPEPPVGAGGGSVQADRLNTRLNNWTQSPGGRDQRLSGDDPHHARPLSQTGIFPTDGNQAASGLDSTKLNASQQGQLNPTQESNGQGEVGKRGPDRVPPSGERQYGESTLGRQGQEQPPSYGRHQRAPSKAVVPEPLGDQSTSSNSNSLGGISVSGLPKTSPGYQNQAESAQRAVNSHTSAGKTRDSASSSEKPRAFEHETTKRWWTTGTDISDTADKDVVAKTETNTPARRSLSAAQTIENVLSLDLGRLSEQLLNNLFTTERRPSSRTAESDNNNNNAGNSNSVTDTSNSDATEQLKCTLVVEIGDDTLEDILHAVEDEEDDEAECEGRRAEVVSEPGGGTFSEPDSVERDNAGNGDTLALSAGVTSHSQQTACDTIQRRSGMAGDAVTKSVGSVVHDESLDIRTLNNSCDLPTAAGTNVRRGTNHVSGHAGKNTVYVHAPALDSSTTETSWNTLHPAGHDAARQPVLMEKRSLSSAAEQPTSFRQTSKTPAPNATDRTNKNEDNADHPHTDKSAPEAQQTEENATNEPTASGKEASLELGNAQSEERKEWVCGSTLSLSKYLTKDSAQKTSSQLSLNSHLEPDKDHSNRPPTGTIDRRKSASANDIKRDHLLEKGSTAGAGSNTQTSNTAKSHNSREVRRSLSAATAADAKRTRSLGKGNQSRTETDKPPTEAVQRRVSDSHKSSSKRKHPSKKTHEPAVQSDTVLRVTTTVRAGGPRLSQNQPGDGQGGEDRQPNGADGPEESDTNQKNGFLRSGIISAGNNTDLPTVTDYANANDPQESNDSSECPKDGERVHRGVVESGLSEALLTTSQGSKKTGPTEEVAVAISDNGTELGTPTEKMTERKDRFKTSLNVYLDKQATRGIVESGVSEAHHITSITSTQTGPTQDGTSQTGPTQDGTSQTGPTQDGTSQTGPTQAGTSQTGPTQAGTSQTGPTQAGTSQTGPTQDGTSQTGPTQDGTSQTGPTQDGTSQTGPTQAGTSQTGPTQAGTSQTGPTQDGTSQTGPTQEGTSQTGPTQARTSQTRPTQDGTSQTGPTQDGTSQTGPTQDGTSQTGPTQAGTSQTRPTQDGASQTGPTQAGTSAAEAAAAATSDVATKREPYPAHEQLNKSNPETSTGEPLPKPAAVRRKSSKKRGKKIVLSLRERNDQDTGAGETGPHGPTSKPPGGINAARKTSEDNAAECWVNGSGSNVGSKKRRTTSRRKHRVRVRTDLEGGEEIKYSTPLAAKPARNKPSFPIAFKKKTKLRTTKAKIPAETDTDDTPCASSDSTSTNGSKDRERPRKNKSGVSPLQKLKRAFRSDRGRQKQETPDSSLSTSKIQTSQMQTTEAVQHVGEAENDGVFEEENPMEICSESVFTPPKETNEAAGGEKEDSQSAAWKQRILHCLGSEERKRSEQELPFVCRTPGESQGEGSSYETAHHDPGCEEDASIAEEIQLNEHSEPVSNSESLAEGPAQSLEEEKEVTQTAVDATTAALDVERNSKSPESSFVNNGDCITAKECAEAVVKDSRSSDDGHEVEVHEDNPKDEPGEEQKKPMKGLPKLSTFLWSKLFKGRSDKGKGDKDIHPKGDGDKEKHDKEDNEEKKHNKDDSDKPKHDQDDREKRKHDKEEGNKEEGGEEDENDEIRLDKGTSDKDNDGRNEAYKGKSRSNKGRSDKIDNNRHHDTGQNKNGNCDKERHQKDKSKLDGDKTEEGEGDEDTLNKSNSDKNDKCKHEKDILDKNK